MAFNHIVKRLCGSLLFIFLLMAPFITEVNEYLSIPKDLVTFKADNSLHEQIPQLNDHNSIFTFHSPTITDDTETQKMYVTASGIPVKKIDVSYLNDKHVYVGGQSVGVQLHTLGVLVVGHHLVKQNDANISPGEEANIEVGDIILEINGEKIKKLDDVKTIINVAGDNDESLALKIKRNDAEIETTLKPVYDEKEKAYQIGLYIRDSATGIGTISFYDPESKRYGALGHVISDVDTKKPIEIYDGKIVSSTVTNITKGNDGFPGEKQARFSTKDKQLGSITKNSPFGIFGKLDDHAFENGTLMPIGLSQDVKEGPAKILTVVEGNKVESFDIEIINSIPQQFPATKGMVIKVTDEGLLSKTGGIVQGMSGSPIIQNDKLIGAVTHVFVNDPTSGYGVHIEWMLDEAGVSLIEHEEIAS